MRSRGLRADNFLGTYASFDGPAGGRMPTEKAPMTLGDRLVKGESAMRMTNILFRIEVALAGLSVLAFIVTLFWGNWIELIFGVDTDGGDGSLELVVVLVLTAATAVVMTFLARRTLANRPRAERGARS
jgi:hypothetical protein